MPKGDDVGIDEELVKRIRRAVVLLRDIEEGRSEAKAEKRPVKVAIEKPQE
jgi:hypothetical protein